MQGGTMARRVAWIALAALAGASLAVAIARARRGGLDERWHGEAAQPVDAARAMAS